jgi:hypothetical protein
MTSQAKDARRVVPARAGRSRRTWERRDAGNTKARRQGRASGRTPTQRTLIRGSLPPGTREARPLGVWLQTRHPVIGTRAPWAMAGCRDPARYTGGPGHEPTAPPANPSPGDPNR